MVFPVSLLVFTTKGRHLSPPDFGLPNVRVKGDIDPVSLGEVRWSTLVTTCLVCTTTGSTPFPGRS